MQLRNDQSMDGQPPEGENGISHWRPASRNDLQSDRIKNKLKKEKKKNKLGDMAPNS